MRANFAGDAATLDTMFARFQHNLEQLSGHMAEIGREFRAQTDLDRGPILPHDDLFAGYDPGAHLSDDLFRNRLAFVVLLNFPLTTLEQRLGEGERWTRRQWAEARLAQQFSRRVPAEVNLANARDSAEADRYVSGYNVWMHHVVGEGGSRLFPARMRLLTHWNLRDLWMKKATGAPVGPDALLDATRKALAALGPAAKDWNSHGRTRRRVSVVFAVRLSHTLPANPP